MLALAPGKMDGKEFVTHTPGYWPDVPAELWNDWKWQLKNRVTSLAQLEQRLTLSNEERSGVLLSGAKLALAVTPHFFNLLERDNPDCPIRRQVIPRIEETWTSPYDMADPWRGASNAIASQRISFDLRQKFLISIGNQRTKMSQRS